ncbi:MAG: signal peptidase II [Thermodesulfobacteriota bacterium]
MKMAGSKDKRYIYGMRIIVVPVVVLLDQITKAIISHRLNLNQTIGVMAGFFNIVYIKNPGAAFGLFRGWGSMRGIFLVIVTLLALIIIIYIYRKTTERLLRFSLSLIAGGAIGNLIDRVRLGEVVDFLDFYIGKYHWPAFNIADSAITVGVFIAVVELYFKKPN